MLQRFEQTQIIVEIPDREIQGISLKRKAIVQSIDIELAAQRIALNLIIAAQTLAIVYIMLTGKSKEDK